jgi:hypothetical protein
MLKLNNFKLFLILSVFVVTGCAMHAAYDDLIDNKYLSVDPLPSPDSPYVGTWTTNMVGGLVCIKINPDGIVKYCQNKMNGTVEKIYAKIYKEANGDLFLINEAGIRYKIIDYSSNYIDTTAYSSKFRFIPGVKSANCEDFLQN